MSTGNRQYQNNLFAHYFSDRGRLIETYNAIAGKECPPDAEIEFLTLENVLFRSGINDLAFIIEGRCIVLVEHQSTVNENMPLRMLMYIADIYRGRVEQKKLYLETLRTIPTPEFFVVYNGRKERKDMEVLRLSDAFMTPPYAEPCLELLVPVYNISKGHNAELLKRCVPLSDYATFVNLVRDYVEQGESLEVAIEKATHDCIENGIMVEYLKKESSEVKRMLIMEWDDEVFAEAMREEGREEGEAKGREEALRETARRLKEAGAEVALIVKATGLTEEEVNAL